MDDQEQFPPCYHDNRFRQLAAWLLYPGADADKPEPDACLSWLIEQPADTEFRAVMFRAVSLPVYGRDSWFLLGWREHSPPWPRYIEPMYKCQLEDDSVQVLRGGAVVRLEPVWRGDLWDIGVADPVVSG